MAVVQFEVSEDLARRIRGVQGSGREVAVIFVMKARRVVEVRVQDVWVNDDATRSFSPDASAPTASGVR